VRNYKANDEVLLGLAKKHDKTTAQILVRYCLQKNWVPLPKSDTPERIVGNADVYGFELSSEDMKTLDDMDEAEAGSIVQWVKNTL
jgi:diketogulonate reductase-like aldo/keto reductase